jgi:hypothetical protein
MSDLSTVLGGYLALRRSLGYKLERAGRLLVEFVAYLDQAGAEHITVEHALGWAMLAADTGSSWRAQRLGVVRSFACYAQAIDAQHAPNDHECHRANRHNSQPARKPSSLVAALTPSWHPSGTWQLPPRRLCDRTSSTAPWTLTSVTKIGASGALRLGQ